MTSTKLLILYGPFIEIPPEFLEYDGESNKPTKSFKSKNIHFNPLYPQGGFMGSLPSKGEICQGTWSWVCACFLVSPWEREPVSLGQGRTVLG